MDGRNNEMGEAPSGFLVDMFKMEKYQILIVL